MSQALEVTVILHPELCDPRRLEDLLIKIQDYGPVLEEIGGELEADFLQNFATEGYGSWPPLSPRTILDRARLGLGPDPMLVRSGRLVQALTQRGAEGHKFLVSNDTVIVGVYGDVIPYANRLAEGDPEHNLPARILINVTAETMQRIVMVLMNWLGGPNGVEVIADAPLSFNTRPWALAV